MSSPGRNAQGNPIRGADDNSTARQGMMASLQNSPIGKTLGPGAPRRATVIAALVGMILGLATAYLVFPIEYAGAAPRQLSQRAVEQWVRMIAVGHSDQLQYDDANALLALQQIPDPTTVVAQLQRDASISQSERTAIGALSSIGGYESLTGAPAPSDPGIVVSSLQILLALVVVALGLPAVVIVWNRFFSDADLTAPPAADAQAEMPPRATPRATRAESRHQPWQQDETEESGGLHPQHGLPVVQGISNYVKGSAYDESFAIELGPEAGNQFLGECGLSTATLIGNELQAVEFWGFDMASQETRTKVFAAPAAVSDPALVAAVSNRVADPASDIAPATVGAVLMLETRALQLQAEVRDVVCNYAGGAPNSGIERLQIEIIAWRKSGGDVASPAPSGENPFADYGDASFQAPGAGSAPMPPPPVAGTQDAAPKKKPPAKRPEDEEEDPFGGTGNFMPYS